MVGSINEPGVDSLEETRPEKGLKNRSGLNSGVGLDSNRKAAKIAVSFQLAVQTQTQVRQGGRRVSGPYHS
jgi:hypothetical protein